MKTLKRLGFLGRTTLVATFILASCTEEIGPCWDIEQQVKSLEQKMNQTTGAERAQYRQKYLAEKHILENCYNSQ